MGAFWLKLFLNRKLFGQQVLFLGESVLPTPVQLRAYYTWIVLIFSEIFGFVYGFESRELPEQAAALYRLIATHLPNEIKIVLAI
jgi:hypothetical protein